MLPELTKLSPVCLDKLLIINNINESKKIEFRDYLNLK